MLVELISIVLPVYLCAGVGFVWVRSGRDYDTVFMTDLVMLVGGPCLAFSKLVSSGIGVDRLVHMSVGAGVATALLSAVAYAVLRLTRAPVTTFLAPMVFGNTGNMGIPLCYFAFGEEGLALGICFFATTAFLQFSLGIWFWSGRLTLRELARTPLLIAVLLAFAVIGFELTMPLWLMRTTTLLGDFTVPIMQFTLGVSLGRLHTTHVGRSVLFSAVKLGAGAAIGYGVGLALGFEGVALGVIVLDCAMPVAVFNYMFAAKFDRDPGEVASLVVISTLLSFGTLPIILPWLLALTRGS